VNWEDCLLHARGVLDDDIAKTIFAEDFANVVTRICGFDDSSEERKKCVVCCSFCAAISCELCKNTHYEMISRHGRWMV
jgi:hypothetical protein